MPLVSGDSYASIAQFFGPGGLPQTALGAKTVDDVQAALDMATEVMDDCFRGRWGEGFQFSSVGLSVSRHCVAIARNLFMGGRGFSPVAGADEDLIAALKDAEEWCDKVQRRVLFPNVTIYQAPNYSAQPEVLSYSVVNVATGGTAATRGW